MLGHANIKLLCPVVTNRGPNKILFLAMQTGVNVSKFVPVKMCLTHKNTEIGFNIC